ncbi:uncharacterized protein LOC128546088 [Mercenaria mercenaria]|uniref:uncharacterized protein LOC128546088 n=1 Tax=Mercenaria mercenaria TaxID=6596 RepID=UPI00234F42B7|nr:uncharacterized protein LOC128546088 [Mercenaria mercenaria]
MSTVQGISQFNDKYNFVTQQYHHGYGISETIAITILKNSTSGLLLNGESMSYWNATKSPVSPPFDQYITFFVNVAFFSYNQLRQSGGVKFGAVFYGRLDTDTAYGYPLSMSFVDTECETHEASFRTTPAYDRTSTVSTLPDKKGISPTYVSFF